VSSSFAISASGIAPSFDSRMASASKSISNSNRKVGGGLVLPPKTVETRLGHCSIVMTMDIYGHLFPQSDDGSELAAAERRLLR
jgi:integrase